MSTILCFSVNMGCCVYINEEKKWTWMILANGCNITKSEKFKGVWILSVPTVYQSDNNYLKWPKPYFGKLYWKCNLFFYFDWSPIRLHGEGGVYDLYCSQPPGGDQRARSFTFPDMWGTPGID